LRALQQALNTAVLIAFRAKQELRAATSFLRKLNESIELKNELKKIAKLQVTPKIVVHSELKYCESELHEFLGPLTAKLAVPFSNVLHLQTAAVALLNLERSI